MYNNTKYPFKKLFLTSVCTKFSYTAFYTLVSVTNVASIFKQWRRSKHRATAFELAYSLYTLESRINNFACRLLIPISTIPFR